VGVALAVGVAVIVVVDVGTGVALLVTLAVGDPVGSGPFVQALNTSTPATATAPTAATRIDAIVRIFPPKPLRDTHAAPTLSNAFPRAARAGILFASSQFARWTLESFIYYGLGKGGAATATAMAPATLTFFDNYVEYEFVDDGTHPVILAVGDSITKGQGAGIALKSWPAQMGMLTGASVINLGCSGVTTSYFNSPTAELLTKHDVPTYAADEAIITLGTRDSHNSVTLATFQTQLKLIVDNLRALGVRKTRVGNFAPRNDIVDGSAEDLLRAPMHAWMAFLPMGVHSEVDFDTALRDPVNPIKMRADWTTDNVHLVIGGYIQMAREASNLTVLSR